MLVSIKSYQVANDPSAEFTRNLKGKLARQLQSTPGFQAMYMVTDRDGHLTTISLFDDQDVALAAGEPMYEVIDAGFDAQAATSPIETTGQTVLCIHGPANI
ncbi:conserved protein of unknown function [Rhodovastum atsumiense]|uniref:ABM domain-containing protein n=1 Tax=Rhodovastum atsumiense TaxID=504468 RepID=A0A5M6J097_9PROT|nr:hypothetical protein [Rhodovastum atsumiense]KAA5613507.1 hypothetical protein F1189_05475 [Rhodovastum atsumiense]CAH2603254.1 conserved protein of unknown function [Rhodovastum atsumiense]